MDDHRFGTVIRSVRQRRRWRQVDLAAKSHVSPAAISRLVRGQVGPQSIDRVRTIAAALDIGVDLVPRWRAGDLDRLLNARHSALHESVARWFRQVHATWTLAPEASFAIYADRGVVDILAWHPGRRAILVIELKTDLADMNELLGTLDRKRRVAHQVGMGRGWDGLAVSAWLVIADSRTNRRRVAAHEAMLRAALPHGGATIRGWLRDPIGSVGALSFWSDGGVASHPRPMPRRRVRANGPVSSQSDDTRFSATNGV